MKNIFSLALIGLSLSVSIKTQAVTLESELEALAVPANQGPVSVADKLYAIQSRFAPLARRHEFAFSLGNQVNQVGHLNTNMMGGMYRYHVNDSWALGVNHFRMHNELSATGKRLLSAKGELPDRDFIAHQTDLMVEYNLFYGKMRFNMEQVTYFDQYLALGVSQLALGRGNTTGFVADAGVAFWLGKNASARLGLKNDFYKEQNYNGAANVHNVSGYVAFGYLLGGNQ
jgi:outer membrane beta-barrel protein